MKKRTLLAGLLVIPMGAAFAWHEGRPHIRGEAMNQDEAMLGTQSVNIRQCRSEPRLGTQAVTYVTICDGPESEARLGTQSATVRQNESEPILGTQSAR